MISTTFLRIAAATTALGLTVAGCSGGAGSEEVGESSSAITPISGCDYSFARPSPSSLVSMGYKFVARYLSGDPSSGKDLTASEANALEAAGLDLVVVWETTGTDAQNGYNQGVSDAQAAKSEAVAVGQPSTRPIYFALDWDVASSQASAVDAYFQGVASVIGLSRTGVYGGYYAVNQLFNAGRVKWGWQTYAWSGGAWDSRAQLRQVQNGVDNNQLDADTGMVADYGQWGPNAPTGAAPYAAAFVSQSFPLASTALAMTEGQTIPSYIELKNVGTKTWDSNTRIGTTQPRDRSSVFADGTWLAADRPAAVTGTVAPGGTYKFKFDLHAPATTGTYHEFFGVVQEGVAWFSDPGQGGPADNDLEVQIVVSPPEYRGTFVSQTYPSAPTAETMHVGETVTGSITLTNSGTKPWIAGTTKLAPIPRDHASPFADSSWLSTTRASTVPADVQPGQKGTFPLSLTATAVGDFQVELGLVEEGVVWFADEPLGGGPADGFLRVHVTVVAATADAGPTTGDAAVVLDAGVAPEAGVDTTPMADAGIVVDAAITTDGSVVFRDAGKDSGKHLLPSDDAGVQPTDGGPTADAATAAGTTVGSTGGCRVAEGQSSGLAPFAFLGLATLIVRRRRSRS